MHTLVALPSLTFGPGVNGISARINFQTLGRVTIEAVSGGIETGEGELVTAKRELQEELGIQATLWMDLGVVDPFTTSVVSPTRLYLARNLTFGDHAQEGTETISCVQMPLVDAMRMVVNGEISHGPTALLLFKVLLSLSE